MKKTTTPEFDAFVSEAVTDLREQMGIGPNDEIIVHTPQFTRKPGESMPAPWPGDEAIRSAAKDGDKELLRNWGCCSWNDPDDPEDNPNFNGEQLWLFPGEWYSSISAGFEIVTICGDVKTFKPHATDDDIRFGCLSYGVLIKGQ